MEILLVLMVQVLSKSLKFVYEIGMALMLEPKQYGIFSLVLSSSIIVSKLMSLGGELFIVSNASKDIKEIGKILKVLIIFSSVFCFILGVLNVFIKMDNFNLILVFSYFICILSLLSSYIRVQLKTKTSVFFNEILWYLVALFSCFILMGLNLSTYYNYLYATVAALIISVLLAFYFIINKCDFKSFPISVSDFKNIAKLSFPLILTGFLAIFLNRIDVIMLSGYISSEDVGYYNVITKFGTQLKFLYQVLIVYYIPRISKNYFNYAQGELNGVHVKLISLSILSVLFCYFSFLVCDYFIDVYNMFSIPREGYENIMLIMFITSLLSVSLSFYGYFLIFEGGQKYELINIVLVIPLAIFLNIIFIPEYGVLGATLSTSFSILFVNALRVYQFICFKERV